MSELSENIVEIQGLCFARGQRRIFSDLDIKIRRGDVTAIMGPSGTGKTTLLRFITGQLVPDRGSVWVNGYQVDRTPRKGLYEMRRDIGVLFQNGALLSDYNVFENVAFPLREHTDLPERLISHVVLTKLHAVGLRGAWRLSPTELSGGMARRVALARAIVMDPDILLVDEPFSGLDPINVRRIEALLVDLNRHLDLTLIVTSHHMASSLRMADRLVFMVDGIAIAGPPDDLLKSADERIVEFLNAESDGLSERHELDVSPLMDRRTLPDRRMSPNRRKKL
jgi:phospholipid/cholesterol/gamma-HCH transport system ATP-binding protein